MTETEEKPDTKTLVQQLRGVVEGAMLFAEPTMKKAVSDIVKALEIDQGLREPDPEPEEQAEGEEGEEHAEATGEEGEEGETHRRRRRR